MSGASSSMRRSRRLHAVEEPGVGVVLRVAPGAAPRGRGDGDVGEEQLRGALAEAPGDVERAAGLGLEVARGRPWVTRPSGCERGVVEEHVVQLGGGAAELTGDARGEARVEQGDGRLEVAPALAAEVAAAAQHAALVAALAGAAGAVSLPHRQRSSSTGPKVRAQYRPSRSGLPVRRLIVSGLRSRPLLSGATAAAAASTSSGSSARNSGRQGVVGGAHAARRLYQRGRAAHCGLMTASLRPPGYAYEVTPV
jgi:hypothetical protein